MRVIVAMLVFALAGCQDDTAPGPAHYDLFAAQQAACVSRGGQFARAGMAGGYTCFHTPRDAGQMCAKASDCESACLARTRSCAPITPIFGCFDVLGESGRPARLCVD